MSTASPSRWLPFVVWVALVVALLHPGSAAFRWVGRQPWGDKITHVLCIGVATFLLDFALAARRRAGIPLAVLVVFAFMTAEELSQLWTPGRSFEWLDLAANYTGIGLAWLSRKFAV